MRGEIWLGRVVAVALLGLVAWVALGTPGGGPTLERMITYPVDEPIQFVTSPEANDLKLVLWARRPPAWSRDVRATAPVLFQVTARAADGVIWQHQAWIRFRWGLVTDDTGAVSPPGHAEDDERGFLADLSDERLWRIPGETVAAATALEVEILHAPPGTQVLAVGFEATTRPIVAQLRAEESPGPNLIQRLRDVTVLDWSEVDPDLRAGMVAQRWNRLGAVSADGQFLTENQAILTSFQNTPWADAAAHGVPVVPGGALAYNFDTQVVVTGQWHLPDGAPSEPVRAWLRWVDPTGTMEVIDLGSVDHFGPLAHPGGTTSLEVALDPEAAGPRTLRVEVDGPDPDRSLGDPARVWSPRAPTRQWLGPDFRALEVYRVGPELPPVWWEVGQGETVRLVVRARLPGGRLHAFAPPPVEPPLTLQVQAFDAAGAPIADAWTQVFEPRASAFERYTQGDRPDLARVAEPEVSYLRIPVGTEALAVSAAATADVSLRVLDERIPERILEKDYDVLGDDPWLRYEPYARDPWRVRAPIDHEGLALAERVLRVDAQVRLHAPPQESVLTGADDDDHGRLPLPLRYPFELVAEQATAVGTGLRTRVGAVPVALDVPPSGRLWLDYRARADAVGSTVSIEVGGMIYERELATAGGTLRLDGLPVGRTTAAARFPGLLLARAPGERPWRVRRVYEVPPGGSVGVTIPTGAQSMAVYAYAGDVALTWSLVAGRPAPGLHRHLSDLDGSLGFPGAGDQAGRLSFAGPTLPVRGRTVIRFEEDRLEPGRVRIDNPGTTPAWVRFTATWAEPEPAGDWHLGLGSP